MSKLSKQRKKRRPAMRGKADAQASVKKTRTRALLVVGGALAACAVIVCVWVFFISGAPEDSYDSYGEIPAAVKKAGWLERNISRDEYAFFEAFVKRDLWQPTDEELAAKTDRMILEVNAKFAIGSHLGLCETFTYEGMLGSLARENAERKRMKEAGEVFYGPVSFDAIGYFQFLYSNLELEIVGIMRENFGDALRDQVLGFYHNNKERYQSIEGVRYEYTVNGITEEISVTRNDLKTMSRLGDELGDFLLTMEYEQGSVWEGEYEDEFGLVKRRAKVLEVTIDRPSFEEVEFTVALEYVREVYYPEVVESAIQLSKLRF
ncbi:MAG: hypothetical protein FWE59_04465 [Oscillospiraceae bacterium]|nr:hypothetical protein [Oscillospiraceae bacterium]